MGGVVAAAGAAQARAQRAVISHFMSSNAVGPDKAVPFLSSQRLEQKCFDRFRGLGVIQPATSGGYYLDIPAYDAWRRQQRRVIVTIMLIALLVLATGLAVALVAAR